MRKAYLVLVLVMISNLAFSRSEIDSVLFKKIAAMYKEDQKWRIEYDKLNRKGKSDFTAEVIDKNWTTTDSLNMAEAKRIISKHGYPGYALVGEKGSSRFWAIVQHCDNDIPFQEQVLKLMNTAVLNKDANGVDFAYLTDRVLANKGEKQIYGTQTLLNKESRKYVPHPIENPAEVNLKRKSVGLNTLEEYLKSMNDRL